MNPSNLKAQHNPGYSPNRSPEERGADLVAMIFSIASIFVRRWKLFAATIIAGVVIVSALYFSAATVYRLPMTVYIGSIKGFPLEVPGVLQSRLEMFFLQQSDIDASVSFETLKLAKPEPQVLEPFVFAASPEIAKEAALYIKEQLLQDHAERFTSALEEQKEEITTWKTLIDEARGYRNKYEELIGKADAKSTPDSYSFLMEANRGQQTKDMIAYYAELSKSNKGLTAPSTTPTKVLVGKRAHQTQPRFLVYLALGAAITLVTAICLVFAVEFISAVKASAE